MDSVQDVAVVLGPGRAPVGPEAPAGKAALFGIAADRIVEYRLVHLRGRLDDGQIESLAQNLLVDRVGQWWMRREEHLPPTRLGRAAVVETGLRPGVTDREGAELVRSAREQGLDLESATIGRRWFIYGPLRPDQIETIANRVLHNEVIERWALDELAPAHTDPSAEAPATGHIPVAGLGRDELAAISTNRRLGLSADEMVAIRDWFEASNREPTDAELETLAQTWSEHCSHKTFRAYITTDDGHEIDGLLKTFLRGATDKIDVDWIESAFVDNAGIVHFDETHDLALKAETHNHPSALEPFGGANTGVGGVVRDILGVSAKPIAITDVLCFGPQDLDPAELPDGVLHPRRIRSGVIAGIGDYGNKIGVPTVAGAIIHDPSYTTTPLVFAGCIGLLPRGSNPTDAKAGDAIVVLGGRVGRDGVGGATFSSQSMNTSTADVAGSAVQIGDPVVEKGLIDVVLEAREQGLYTAITDCGAGGLSSAVGEMAEVLGATVDLALVPRKYPGLAPWETWLSEAQERMVVATDQPEELLALARRWQVEATTIGRFTGDGHLVVVDGDEIVVDLPTSFLHDGRPRLYLDATMAKTDRPQRVETAELDGNAALKALLAHPSIRSNEAVVRTFDHEVQGGTVVRPYDGINGDGPADGTVVVPQGTVSPVPAVTNDEVATPIRGVAIGIGSAILVGRLDPEAMAWAAVDEAIRNAVVAGADPDRISLLDNFAWGSPNDPVALGGLVAACQGCHDAALAHRAPFVSGKDSLFNEFVDADGQRDPVTPTLIITAVGIVPNIKSIPAVGLMEAGNDVWLIGPDAGALGGSYFDETMGGDHGGPPPQPDASAADRHRGVHAAIAAGIVQSAHDISDGGLATAAAEWAYAGRLGMTLAVAEHHSTDVLFGEGPGRYLVEIAPGHTDALLELLPDARRIGWTTEEQRLRIGTTLDLSLDEIGAAFNPVPGDDEDDERANL